MLLVTCVGLFKQKTLTETFQFLQSGLSCRRNTGEINKAAYNQHDAYSNNTDRLDVTSEHASSLRRRKALI